MKRIIAALLAAMLLASVQPMAIAATESPDGTATATESLGAEAPATEPGAATETSSETAATETVSEAAPAAPATPEATDAEYADIPDGWSRDAVVAAIGNGLLQGYEGFVYPQEQLTRAQMAAILVRAFGATKQAADLSAFSDADPAMWYYRELSVAVGIGLFLGDAEGTLRPDSDITREEAALVLSRAFYLLDADVSFSEYSDAGDISDWARDGLAALIKAGKMEGYEDATLRPKSFITREEFAQLMFRLVVRYITEPGEYTFDADGTVVIRVPGVVLKDCNIAGDLILGDDLAREDVTIDNTRIAGRLIVRGAQQIGESDTPLGAPDAGGTDGASAPAAGTVGAGGGGGGGGGGDGVPVPIVYTLNVTLSIPSRSVYTQMADGLPGDAADGMDGLFYLTFLDHIQSNSSYLKTQIDQNSISTGLFAPLFDLFRDDVSLADIATANELLQYVSVAPGSAASASQLRDPYVFLGDMVGTTTLIFDDQPIHHEMVVSIGRNAGRYTMQVTMTAGVNNLTITSSSLAGADRLYDNVFGAIRNKLGALLSQYGLDSYMAAGDYVGEIESWFAALPQAELSRMIASASGDAVNLSDRNIAIAVASGSTFSLNYSGATVTVSVS